MSTRQLLALAALALAGTLCALVLVTREDSNPARILEPPPSADAPAAANAAPGPELHAEAPAPASVAPALDLAPDADPAGQLADPDVPSVAPRAGPIDPMHVLVTDEFGAPIRGARARCVMELATAPWRRVASATSDERGVATVEAAGCADARLVVRPAEGDDAHAEVSVDVAPWDRRPVVVMPTRHWLRLSVVDARERAVVELERVHLKTESGATALLDRSRAPTGAHAIEVPRERGTVTLWSERAGSGSYAYDPARPSTMSGRLELTRAAALEVVVTSSGKPTAGIRVVLLTRCPVDCDQRARILAALPPTGSEQYLAEESTDAQGRVEFALERAGESFVIAESAGRGWAEGRVAIERTDQEARLELELAPGGEAEFRVRDARGKPVADAHVSLYGPGVTRRDAITDASGRFLADSLPPGLYTVACAPPGRIGANPARGQHFEARVGERARVGLSLEPRSRLDVEVRGEDRVCEAVLYAGVCPLQEVETVRVREGRARLGSDDTGAHLLVVRDHRLRSQWETLHVVALDLRAGANAIVVEPPLRDATIEVVVARDRPQGKLWFRTRPRPGVEVYYVLSRAPRSFTKDDSKQGPALACAVPSGSGDLVAATGGGIEVLAENVLLASGATRCIYVDPVPK